MTKSPAGVSKVKKGCLLEYMAIKLTDCKEPLNLRKGPGVESCISSPKK